MKNAEMKNGSKPTTAEEMRALIRARFPEASYAVLDEVANGTGARANRWIDCLVMGLWPSRGLEIIGIEIKVSRSDWIREMQQPAKAESLWAYCDRWYVAVNDPKLILPSELPKGWGLLYPHEKGLRAKVEADLRPDAKFDRGFLASVMRRVANQSTPAARVKAAFEEGKKEGIAWGNENVRYAVEGHERTIHELKTAIREFQEASGVEIGRWSSNRKIGEAVKLILNGQEAKAMERLTLIRNNAASLVKTLDEALKTDDDRGEVRMETEVKTTGGTRAL